jgi:hypothetical protein
MKAHENQQFLNLLSHLISFGKPQTKAYPMVPEVPQAIRRRKLWRNSRFYYLYGYRMRSMY